MTNKTLLNTEQASQKRQTIIQWDRRSFCFSEIIGTAAAGPAGPVPATLLGHAQLERKNWDFVELLIQDLYIDFSMAVETGINLSNKLLLQ